MYDSTQTIQSALNQTKQSNPIKSTQQTNIIDFRIFNIPERLKGIIGIRKTLDQALPDIETIQNSKIWTILQNISKNHSTYGNLLNKNKKLKK